MQQLAARLRERHRVEVVIEPADLAAADGAATLQRRLDARKIEPDIVINNAGAGLHGAFVEHDSARLRALMQLDVVAITELTHLYGKRMADRGSGYLLLIASMMAYGPCPSAAAYGAAKAYVLSLAHALHMELAPNVGVTVLSPGLMETGFLGAADWQSLASAKRLMGSPAEAVRIGLDAMFARKPAVIAGRLNNAIALISRILPRQVHAKMALRSSG